MTLTAGCSHPHFSVDSSLHAVRQLIISLAIVHLKQTKNVFFTFNVFLSENL